MAWPKSFHPAGLIEKLKQKIASLQQQWRSTRAENERLRKENEQLRQEQGRLRGERERLREENERLKRQLEEAQRANKRQAAPFSSRNRDRKSTRLNSSHGYISYAVFCLKKKKQATNRITLYLPHMFACTTRGHPAPTIQFPIQILTRPIRHLTPMPVPSDLSGTYTFIA